MSKPPLIKLNDLTRLHADIGGQCLNAAMRVLATQRFVGGDEVESFETEFARYVGTDYCVAVGSGMDALLLTYRTLGINADSTVVLQVNTFAAAASAAKLLGARIRFVDCLEDGSMNPGETLAACDGADLCVVTHLWGHPVERKFIESITVPVIEDCAQAHGATFDDGSHVGTAGVAATFSFYPSKVLGAWGDGGAVCTSKHVIHERVSVLRNHGRVGKHTHVQHAYNSRLDALQAAVLRVKLAHLSRHVEARVSRAARYRSLGVEAACSSPLYVYPILCEDRRKLVFALRAAGIEPGVHYGIPLHMQTAFGREGYAPGDFRVAERLSRMITSLPLHPFLTREEQERVVEVVRG